MSDEKKDKFSSDELKKQILGSIAKPFTGEQTSRWIANLDDDSLVNELTDTGPTAALNLTSVAIVDKLFDEFQRYAYEYLRTTAAAGERFVINVGRPAVNDAPLNAQYGQIPILCQGHVSTAHWAMIFVAHVGKVLAFILPVEYTVGFHPSQNTFAPYVEMKAVTEKNKTDWRVGGYSISAEMLPLLAKRFFGSLIKVERQEAKHTDAFVMDPSMRPEEIQMPKRLEESDRIELLSDAVLQQEQEQKQQFQKAAQGQYQPQQLQPAQQQYQQVNQQQPQQQYQQPQQPAHQQQAQQQYQQPPNQQQPQYQPPQGYEQQPHIIQAQPPQRAPMPVSQADPLEALTVTRAFDRNNLVIQAALNEFLDKIDLELDTLTKIGMKTIQVQDMAGAQRTIIRSAKLKEMRQRVNDLSNEWKSVVSES